VWHGSGGCGSSCGGWIDHAIMHDHRLNNSTRAVNADTVDACELRTGSGVPSCRRCGGRCTLTLKHWCNYHRRRATIGHRSGVIGSGELRSQHHSAATATFERFLCTGALSKPTAWIQPVVAAILADATTMLKRTAFRRASIFAQFTTLAAASNPTYDVNN
jgi:hypothetical protein